MFHPAIPSPGNNGSSWVRDASRIRDAYTERDTDIIYLPEYWRQKGQNVGTIRLPEAEFDWQTGLPEMTNPPRSVDIFLIHDRLVSSSLSEKIGQARKQISQSTLETLNRRTEAIIRLASGEINGRVYDIVVPANGVPARRYEGKLENLVDAALGQTNSIEHFSGMMIQTLSRGLLPRERAEQYFGLVPNTVNFTTEVLREMDRAAKIDTRITRGEFLKLSIGTDIGRYTCADSAKPAEGPSDFQPGQLLQDTGAYSKSILSNIDDIKVSIKEPIDGSINGSQSRTVRAYAIAERIRDMVIDEIRAYDRYIVSANLTEKAHLAENLRSLKRTITSEREELVGISDISCKEIFDNLDRRIEARLPFYIPAITKKDETGTPIPIQYVRKRPTWVSQKLSALADRINPKPRDYDRMMKSLFDSTMDSAMAKTQEGYRSPGAQRVMEKALGRIERFVNKQLSSAYRGELDAGSISNLRDSFIRHYESAVKDAHSLEGHDMICPNMICPDYETGPAKEMHDRILNRLDHNAEKFSGKKSMRSSLAKMFRSVSDYLS